MREFIGLSAPSLGEGKDMEVADVRFLQELIGFPELFFPFPGETDDNIYPDIEIRDSMDQSLDEVGKEGSIVIAVHSPKDIILSALHRDVEMVAHSWGGGDGLNQFRGKIVGFDGAKPDPLGCRDVLHFLAELCQ